MRVKKQAEMGCPISSMVFTDFSKNRGGMRSGMGSKDTASSNRVGRASFIVATKLNRGKK